MLKSEFNLLSFSFPVGIVSEAAVVSLQMMFIVWSMKQERLMQENSLDAPAQWLKYVILKLKVSSQLKSNFNIFRDLS